MAGNVIFVAPLHGLECPGVSDGRGFELEERLFLSKDSAYYTRLIDRHFTGSSDVRAHVYAEELRLEGLARLPFLHTDQALKNRESDLSQEGERFTATWVYVSQALWLVKVNSVNFHRCVGSGTLEPRRLLPWRSTVLAHFFDANATLGATSFSLEELRQARVNLRRMSELLAPLASATTERGGVLLVKSHRLVRATFFLNSARLTPILPVRIAQYVTCLEALLATDQSELKHRLCERVALFLEHEGAEQEQLYEAMSLAYTVRSAVVHGDRVKLDAIRLSDISHNCDEIIRRAFNKILGSDELIKLFDEQQAKPDQLDKYFKQLLFRRCE